MQLKHKLSMAVGALLGFSGSGVLAQDNIPWLVDTSILSYSEQDSQGQDRITVFKPVLQLTAQKSIDDYSQYRFVFDALSGASPNGAFATSQPQTFTPNAISSPSAATNYTTPAGKTPLDTGFKDTRLAFGYTRMRPIARLLHERYGMDFSTESDYSSLSLNYTRLKESSNKQTTLSIGAAYSYDTVNPKGGFHPPLGWMQQTSAQASAQSEDEDEEREGGESEGIEGLDFNLFSGKPKHTFDALIGVSHVLNRYTTLQLNYTLGYTTGYLTDPYKIVPVLDPTTGDPLTTPPAGTRPYRYEKRPSTRLKQAIKLAGVTAIGKDSLHLSYRYFWDDWGITANTYDVKYHFSLGNALYIQPHYRYSKQTQAEFYTLGLIDGQPLPQYASSDYRLGNMTTETIGAMAGWRISSETTFTLNIEQMTQKGDRHPSKAIGNQKNNDLFPTITATMVTIGVRTKY